MHPGEILLEKADQIIHLTKQFHIREIRVFGSTARGTDTESSDLDLFVTYDEQASLLTHAAFTKAVEHVTGINCDVICDELMNLESFQNMMEISIS